MRSAVHLPLHDEPRDRIASAHEFLGRLWNPRLQRVRLRQHVDRIAGPHRSGSRGRAFGNDRVRGLRRGFDLQQ